jgi:hypothetical protein
MKTRPSVFEEELSKDLYKQVCDEHRFYGDMRFKQLSLYGVITALLVNAMNSKDIATAAISAKTICVIALLSTSVLWVMEVRSSLYGYRCQKAKDQFETNASSGSGIVTDQPSFHWTLLNATNLVLFLYFCSYLFWLHQSWIALGPQAPVRRYSAMAGFMILIAFSVREYWQRWRDHLARWNW